MRILFKAIYEKCANVASDFIIIIVIVGAFLFDFYLHTPSVRLPARDVNENKLSNPLRCDIPSWNVSNRFN